MDDTTISRDPAKDIVRFAAVTKRFASVIAVDRVDLDVREGEFLCLLGPSGCGKTTLLRMLAGFERPDYGRVLLDGVDITNVPPHRRPVNMMFQSYALFPHMSVEKNIAFGLRQEGVASADIAARVREMLALVRLEGMAARKPHQLSGGQKQRVALARALIKRPRVLLLDEPMAALDRKLREETQIELKALQARLGLTFVTVTHDQTEAMTMADRIAVMHAGRIAQVGAPREVYERPANLQVARFIGDATVFEGSVRAIASDDIALFECAQPDVALTVKISGEPRSYTHVAVRPEHVRAFPWRPSDEPNIMQGQVTQALYRGDARLLIVDVDGAPVRILQSNAAGAAAELAVGSTAWLSIAPDALVLLIE